PARRNASAPPRWKIVTSTRTRASTDPGVLEPERPEGVTQLAGAPGERGGGEAVHGGLAHQAPHLPADGNRPALLGELAIDAFGVGLLLGRVGIGVGVVEQLVDDRILQSPEVDGELPGWESLRRVPPEVLVVDHV